MPSNAHYTALIALTKTIPAHKENNSRGYPDIQVERTSHEVAKISLRADSLEELKSRIAAHVGLVSE